MPLVPIISFLNVYRVWGAREIGLFLYLLCRSAVTRREGEVQKLKRRTKNYKEKHLNNVSLCSLFSVWTVFRAWLEHSLTHCSEMRCNDLGMFWIWVCVCDNHSRGVWLSEQNRISLSLWTFYRCAVIVSAICSQLFFFCLSVLTEDCRRAKWSWTNAKHV